MLWFFVFGFLLALWGGREWAGGALLSLAVGTAIPASGFWLVLAVCLAKGWQERRRSVSVAGG